MTITVGGLLPFTMIDFPGHVAAVVFTQGCAWKCSYCHNADLQTFCADDNPDALEWGDVLALLEKRKGKLDGVVFSGGEPLMQKDIATAIKQVKDMGYKVALHTGGSNPRRFIEVLPLLDWVGFDMKHRWDVYDKVTGASASATPAQESLKMLIDSGIDFEVRTTVDPRILSKDDIHAMAGTLAEMGVTTYVLQQYETPRHIEDDLDDTTIGAMFQDEAFLNTLAEKIPNFSIRSSLSQWKPKSKAA